MKKVQLHPKLEAARWRLIRGVKPDDPLARPYLAAALFSLIPAGEGKGKGCPTVGVDGYWRIYWNKGWVDKQEGEEGMAILVAVMAHEVAHLLRRHHARMRHFPLELARIATDLEINDDLEAEGFQVDGFLLPGRYGLPDGLLAEEYARLIGQQLQQMGSGAASSPDGQSEAEAAPQATGEGEPSGDGSAEDQSGSGKGSDSLRGLSSGGGSRSGCGGLRAPVASRPGGQAEASPSGSDSGPGGQAEASPSDSGRGDAPSCGSCSHGRREEWEYGPDDPDSPGRITEEEGDLIARRVAHDIEKTRGTVPASWRAWAEQVLASPRIPWRRVFAATVRRAAALAAGLDDYSYTRPSRRQGVVRVGDPIKPASVRRRPRVAVVVDVSGSMSDRELERALAEVVGIIREVGQVELVVCDADVHAVKRAVKARDLTWRGGGGGTDMRVGIERALEGRPDLVVVFTDGETPWPAVPTKVPLVVALTAKPSYRPPSWAKVVEVGG